MSNEATRNIWTHPSSYDFADLLRTSLASLVFCENWDKPFYLISPWVTDFDLFDNRFRDYSGLFPTLSDEDTIRFSDYLLQLASLHEVRIITTDNPRSKNFVLDDRFATSEKLKWRWAASEDHEKGFLAPQFYIHGSMNWTHHGVKIRKEKVVYTTAISSKTSQTIAGAYIEFERHWKALES